VQRQKTIQLLNEQLNEVRVRQSHDQTLMQETMSRELEEVRNAVREY